MSEVVDGVDGKTKATKAVESSRFKHCNIEKNKIKTVHIRNVLMELDCVHEVRKTLKMQLIWVAAAISYRSDSMYIDDTLENINIKHFEHGNRELEFRHPRQVKWTIAFDQHKIQ